MTPGMKAHEWTTLVALAALLLAACSSSGPVNPFGFHPEASPEQLAAEAGVALTEPPYDRVHTQWKERVAQPYVYFDHHGPRESFGETINKLMEHAYRVRIETAGPPFGLYGPDGSARACLPVHENPGRNSLPYAVLPKAMVAYAVVRGPYPQAPLAVDGLRSAMAQSGWEARGPVRESYLVNPGTVEHYGQLATEIQIPWAILP